MTDKPRPRKNVIKRLREAKGWGQQELADQAVVSVKTINSLERGNAAQLSTFRKIAKALGIPPSDLLEGHAPATADAPVASAAGKCVELKLTLLIPWESFDETEGIDRLTAFLTSVIQAKHALAVTELNPGSVEVSLLVDEEDAPQLIEAFAANRLDPIHATELAFPQKLALLFVAAVVSMPIFIAVIPVLPFIAVILVITYLRTAGFEVAVKGDEFIHIKRTTAKAPPTNADDFPALIDIDPLIVRQAIAIVSPLWPPQSFPYSMTLRLESHEEGGPTPTTLGERLESMLLGRERLRSKVMRVKSDADWSGDIFVELAAPDDMRDLIEVLLVGFLEHPVMLVVRQTGERSFQGIKFKADGETTLNLSFKIWEAMWRDLVEKARLHGWFRRDDQPSSS